MADKQAAAKRRSSDARRNPSVKPSLRFVRLFVTNATHARTSTWLGLSEGLRMEMARVMAWTAAMTGQMRKTYDAGVIEVAKYELNWALDVVPKFLVMTEVSVAIPIPAGVPADGMAMDIETRPKHASELIAAAWFASRTPRETTSSSSFCSGSGSVPVVGGGHLVGILNNCY